MSQQIWIKISIALAILCTYIKIDKFRAGKRRMYKHLPRRHAFGFGWVTSFIVTGWHRSRCRRMWHQFGYWLSELGWWQCTDAFVPPASRGFLWCATVASRAAIHLFFQKHSQVLFHHNPHIMISGEHNSPLFLIPDFSFFHTYWPSFIVPHENPPLAILATFMARCMSDCSSCTQSPCLAKVADRLKTYNKFIDATTYEVLLLPLPSVSNGSILGPFLL